MATKKVTYISNPLELVQPSAAALGKNLAALIGLIGVIVGVWILAAATSVIWLTQQLTDSFTNPFGIALFLAIGASILAFLISLLLYPSSNIVLLASAQDKKIGLKQALKQGMPYIWRTLGVSVLMILATIGGLILFIIPGLIFFAWFLLSPYVVVNENLGVIESMKRSKQIIKGRVWELWGLIMLPSAASAIPFIGGIVSFVLSIAMIPATAIRYVQLSTIKEQDRPAVHWSNYLVLVLGVLGSSVSSATNDTLPVDTNF
jgi:uncharacterized membrane protein